MKDKNKPSLRRMIGWFALVFLGSMVIYKVGHYAYCVFFLDQQNDGNDLVAAASLLITVGFVIDDLRRIP